MTILLAIVLALSLAVLLVTEVYRSGMIIYLPGQKRKPATRLQLAMLLLAASSGFTLLIAAYD